MELSPIGKSYQNTPKQMEHTFKHHVYSILYHMSAEDMQNRAVLLPLLLIQVTKKGQKNSKCCKPD